MRLDLLLGYVEFKYEKVVVLGSNRHQISIYIFRKQIEYWVTLDILYVFIFTNDFRSYVIRILYFFLTGSWIHKGNYNHFIYVYSCLSSFQVPHYWTSTNTVFIVQRITLYSGIFQPGFHRHLWETNLPLVQSWKHQT